ncbi:MAG: response regulator [Candidatus Edwardsbacteria bacterium]|nr:response regulator [Candidatus Edwardsbacteria bacterium]MBU1576129.1 response regulator [Candidatus Edwardsbacteria bacterium]MBU2463343.1 response regulator [Candidatus Edwardsbacteria bacterium]MBU2593169.1 response regulator [Candidatus Edwardsbacteria bacterium]
MSKKIMIIDDEPAVGEMMTTLLESEGYEAMVAYDGQDGLEQMGKTPADLLLLDYMLPGMDGIEVLCEVRHRWPELPVIMITAFGSPELKARANKFKVVDVVSKPFDTQKLLEQIAVAV